MADPVTRCCLLCGRWGNRAFRPADDGADGWVCTNDRACRIRKGGPCGAPHPSLPARCRKRWGHRGHRHASLHLWWEYDYRERQTMGPVS